MKTFFDKKNNILWRMTDYRKSSTTPEEYQLFRQYNQELNTWTSDNIIEYITYTKQPLGDYLAGLVVRNNKRGDLGEYHQIYAFDTQDNLIGTCIVSAESPFTRQITQDPLLKNSLLLNMIITNPNLAKQGIGSRMINSITKNQGQFVTSKTHGVMAAVNKKNTASQRAFLKNKFKVMQDGRGRLIPDQHDIVFRQYPPLSKKKQSELQRKKSSNQSKPKSPIPNPHIDELGD